MTYQEIIGKLKEHNSNFFYFLKVHIVKNKAIIDTKPFNDEFLEEILRCSKEYKDFEIENKNISLINSIFIDKQKGIIELELSVVLIEIIKSIKEKYEI